MDPSATAYSSNSGDTALATAIPRASGLAAIDVQSSGPCPPAVAGPPRVAAATRAPAKATDAPAATASRFLAIIQTSPFHALGRSTCGRGRAPTDGVPLMPTRPSAAQR